MFNSPLGASFADWFGASRAQTGLGLGAGWVALVLTIMIVGFVGPGGEPAGRDKRRT